MFLRECKYTEKEMIRYNTENLEISSNEPDEK